MADAMTRAGRSWRTSARFALGAVLAGYTLVAVPPPLVAGAIIGWTALLSTADPDPA
jgi:hypothetical protein